MRIDSLWINGHKNFEDFRIDFIEESLINILLGKNGTGKSNIIEVIVQIFKLLDQAKSSKEFFERFKYEFEITYYTVIDNKQNWFLISRTKEHNLIRNAANKGDLTKKNEISFAALKRIDGAFFLPKYIIAYYSGENNRLKQIFKEPEESYYKLVRQNKDQETDFRRFFYADIHHCQLLLVALLTFADQDERIENLLKNYLGYDEFVDFTVTLKSPDWNKDVSLKDGIADFWGAKGTPLRFCNYLFTESEGEPIIDYDSKLEIDNPIREDITFYVRGQRFVANARDYFKTGIDLFRHLESTFISGLIHEIVIRLKKTKNDDVIQFNELSEGEQQLVTIIGLLIFTSYDNTLFLLDEPDTHLNPNWQRDYLKLFNDFTTAKNNHIIISTHSPLLVQAAKDSGLILLKLEDGHPISNSDSHFIKNWRIDQVLTSEYFELVSARPPQLDEFMLVREELLNKPIHEKHDLEKLKRWESQSGLLPSGETLNDFQAMHLVRTIAKEIKANDKNR